MKRRLGSRLTEDQQQQIISHFKRRGSTLLSAIIKFNISESTAVRYKRMCLALMAFPGMIAEAALKAGMKVPNEPDKDWDPEEYPHFSVFCNVQLNRGVRWGEHWENAKVIAAISEDDIHTITLEELIVRGLEWQP
jgi:hypothetical protein